MQGLSFTASATWTQDVPRRPVHCVYRQPADDLERVVLVDTAMGPRLLPLQTREYVQGHGGDGSAGDVCGRRGRRATATGQWVWPRAKLKKEAEKEKE